MWERHVRIRFEPVFDTLRKNSGCGCHAKNGLTFDGKGTSLENWTGYKAGGSSHLEPEEPELDKNLVPYAQLRYHKTAVSHTTATPLGKQVVSFPDIRADSCMYHHADCRHNNRDQIQLQSCRVTSLTWGPIIWEEPKSLTWPSETSNCLHLHLNLVKIWICGRAGTSPPMGGQLLFLVLATKSWSYYFSIKKLVFRTHKQFPTQTSKLICAVHFHISLQPSSFK